MLADDLRTSPTLRLHVGGASGPQRLRSSTPGEDQRGELRPGEEDLLLALSRLARAVLPATSGVCLTLQESTRTTRTLSDTALAEAVDRAQRETGAGPSLAAHRDGVPCCSDDLREDPRWPGLGSRLPASGTSPVSVVALPLSGGALGLGVLAVCGDGHPVLVTEGDVAQLVTLGAVASQLVALLRRARRADSSVAG